MARGRKKQKQHAPEPVEEREEDAGAEDDGAGAEVEDAPELKEKPKGPNARLKRSQGWTKRSDNLMKYSSLDVRNATMEFIGPGAREALLRYNGGSKLAAAGEVEAAKAKALDIAKHAKEVAKHAKATADDAEFLVKAIDTAYIDLLTGQGSIEDVEGGRHKDSKPAEPKPEAAAVPAAAAPAAAPAEGAALVPPGGPVHAQEVAAHLLNLMRQQAAQPEEVAVQVEEPAGLLPAPRVGREPADVPGLDQAIVTRLCDPPSFRELGAAVAREDRQMGVAITDLAGYLSTSLDVLADVQGGEVLELTDEEKAEFRAGQLAALGLADPDAPNPELQGEAAAEVLEVLDPPPAQEQAPELRDYLERARAQGRADAPHNRCLYDAGKLFTALMPPPQLVPSQELLYVAYLEAYEGAGGRVPEEVAQAAATPAQETTAPRARGRRGRRS